MRRSRSRMNIEVDGTWDIEDLSSLSNGLMQLYALLYPLVAPNAPGGDSLASMKAFWPDQREIDLDPTGRMLYQQIPPSERLKLRSFQYGSPGWLTDAGVSKVLSTLSRVVRALHRLGKAGIDLFNQAKRANSELSSEEARHLCFAVCEQLGLNEPACEVVLSLNRDPRSALKYLAAIYSGARELTKLHQAGLLQLPRRRQRDATSIQLTLFQSAAEERPRRLPKPKSKPRSPRSR